ncbi:hypothetical protein NEOKW01_1887 [Nematocida sp. AWRm80]|nr:hypothetical protein NEOKW01_1887 [Nematocida sp. AWRm80]
MNISNNLRQLKFMKNSVKEKEQKKETLGTWLLKELSKKESTTHPHKKEKKI